MKVAFISDIHGNLQALEAVVEDIRKNNVDDIICLGDVATLGAQPNECIELLKILNCRSITGNHESALSDMYNAVLYKIAPQVIPVLQWAKSKVTEAELEFLNSFEPRIDLPINSDNTILCYHGSPANNTDNILPTTSAEEMDVYFSNYHNKFFIGGHTHIQMSRPFKNKQIINCGSVGMPFLETVAPGQPPTVMLYAEYVIVDFNDTSFSVNMKRLSYNTTKLYKVLKASDNPLKEWWLEQF